MSKTELELQSYTAAPYLEHQNGPAGKVSDMAGGSNRSRSVNSRQSYGQTLGNDPGEPETEILLKRWNESKTMVFRVFTSFWCMLVLGSTDGQIGAIIPYVSFQHELLEEETALIELSSFNRTMD